MNEDLLAFAWRYQYIRSDQMTTEAGEPLTVFRTGRQNLDSGPDFSDARIKIGIVEWVGSVEIHVNSSDWYVHRHETDRAYESVVLHVVWHHDREVLRADGTVVPVIELKGKVRQVLVERFSYWMETRSPIPCADQFFGVDSFVKRSMIEKMLTERLERKARAVISLWEACNHDWDETVYRLICRQMGGSLNGEAFSSLAERLSFKMLRKHRDQVFSMEALLFGVAGLIPESVNDEYSRKLQKEFQHLRRLYALDHAVMFREEWKFMRLRPAGFPTVRIAQAAGIFCRIPSLLSWARNCSSVEEARQTLQVFQSIYWREHYYFGRVSGKTVPALGRSMADLLIINVIIPVKAAYALIHPETGNLEELLTWLENIPPENNRITRMWSKLGLFCQSAFDSQGVLEWYNSYCSARKCLACVVGNELLKADPD